MGGGGGDDVEGVGTGGGFGGGVKDADVVPDGDFGRGVGVGVKHAGEFDLAGGGEFGVDANVLLAERAGAEHGDFDGLRDVCYVLRGHCLVRVPFPAEV